MKKGTDLFFLPGKQIDVKKNKSVPFSNSGKLLRLGLLHA
jgi:hypothetical protein